MPSSTSSFHTWRDWRPFGIAKRVLTATLGLVVVSSLLAFDAVADEAPVGPQDAPRDRTVLAIAPMDELGSAITAAPVPAPGPAPTKEYVGRVALDPTDHRARLTAFAEQREAERQEEQVRADRQALWFRLADCESGFRNRNGNPIPGSARWDYGLNPSHGAPFEGGLQFAPFTWDGFRDASMPSHAGNASPAQQIAVAERVLAAQGWKAWPVCSRMLGLRD